MSKENPFTPEEFREIYSKVPRLTVEVVLKSEEGVLLSLRDIEPYKGFWHLPGGTVFFDERLTDEVSRVALRELGVTVTSTEFLGYIEYPEYHKQSFDAPVGLAFLAGYQGDLRPNQEATKLEWFRELPSNLIPEQARFITEKVL
jgi:ADP-ribose pyrophosphatase YjhB (NUDIX family)